MSSPPAVKRRSISYTPDDDDEDGYGNGVRSGPSSPAPGAAAPVQGADASTVQDDDEEESEDEDELQTDDDDDDDNEGDGDGDNASRLYDGTMADTTMGDVTMGEANEDVKPSAASLSVGSAKKIKDYQTANARKSETPIPPDVNPGSANLYSTNTGEKLLRNTPIKKVDGTTFHRSDLQHALLMEIFGDTTRCFTNPRPAPDDMWTTAPRPGEAAATGVPEYSPVYPYGQSKGSTRRSNETKEEYEAWEKRWEEYHKNPYPTQEEDPERKVPRPGAKLLTFKELYMEALMNSTRCTKAVRDKVWTDEQFAEDFACVNLLINVGRMNTTLAFYAQMQTVLRSYHPLPCLQGNENSRKHMQDAPRMKSLLKSVLLPFEKASTGPGSIPISKTAQAAVEKHAPPPEDMLEIPGTLEEILTRHQQGHVPATSAVNMIFAFANQANDLTAMHFTHPHDAHSIFFPHKDYPIPARDRAKAFLWLVWHYLEGGALLPPGNEAARKNPFGDERTLTSATRAKAKWNSLDEKGRRKATVAGKGVLWLGVRNKKEKERPLTSSGRDGSPGVSSAGPSGSGSGVAAPPSAAASGSGSIDSTSTAPAHSLIANSLVDDVDASWSVEDSEKYTHRQLAPDWRVISQEEIRKENVDLREELTWGREQAAERRDFMDRMAEEEAAAKAGKAAGAGGGEGADGQDESGKGKGKGKGKGTATKGKGKKSRSFNAPAATAPTSTAAPTGAAGEGSTAPPKRVRKPRPSRSKAAIAAKAEEDAAAAAAAAAAASGSAAKATTTSGGSSKTIKVRRKSQLDEADEMLADLLGGGDEDTKSGAGAGKPRPSAGGPSVPGYDDDSDDSDDEVDASLAAAAGPSAGAEADTAGARSGASGPRQGSSSVAPAAASSANASGLLGQTGSQSLLPPRRPLTKTDLAPGLARAQEQQQQNGLIGASHHQDGAAAGPDSTTLPGLAWNRILQRAVRGQGDACYSSDDEGEAMDEAERCADLFRGELSRLLNVVWGANADRRVRAGEVGGTVKRKREEGDGEEEGRANGAMV